MSGICFMVTPHSRYTNKIFSGRKSLRDFPELPRMGPYDQPVCLKGHMLRAVKMAQRVKAHADKPKVLSSIIGTHGGRGELTSRTCPLCSNRHAHHHPLIYTHSRAHNK